MQVASLFRGEGVGRARKVALRIEKREADATVAALKARLAEAEAKAGKVAAARHGGAS